MFDSRSSSAALHAHAAEWRPGLRDDAVHSEIFASSRDGAGSGFALALARDRIGAKKPDPLAEVAHEPTWLWVQDARAQKLTGLPYAPGLPAGLRRRLIHVAAPTPEDALFALEEGLRCRDLAFVIGEISGNPKALDFTASRRLSLAVERHGVPLWLIRLDARRDLSSARMRWQVRPSPSPPPRWNPEAPGDSAWRAELFRARNHPPGEWILRDDATSLVAGKVAGSSSDPGDLANAIGDRPLAAR